MSRRGLTLIEVLIASVITIVILGVIFAIVFTSQGLYESELPLRVAQHDLQLKMDVILEELRESKTAFLQIVTFPDANYATNQSIIVFPSARNAAGQMQVNNTLPQWQKLIVYCPHFNTSLGLGELRRYEVSPIPQAFTQEGGNPSVQVTADDIILEGIVIDRDTGEKTLSKLVDFNVTLAGGATEVDVTVQGNINLQQNTDMLSGSRSRN